ncbi:MAG: hypothetical protein R3313_03155 [Candidatus Saccharimonadales bacterium]|nr:hypothetical protein [Candidatus Saccharimonadales bacterium]
MQDSQTAAPTASPTQLTQGPPQNQISKAEADTAVDAPQQKNPKPQTDQQGNPALNHQKEIGPINDPEQIAKEAAAVNNIAANRNKQLATNPLADSRSSTGQKSQGQLEDSSPIGAVDDNGAGNHEPSQDAETKLKDLKSEIDYLETAEVSEAEMRILERGDVLPSVMTSLELADQLEVLKNQGHWGGNNNQGDHAEEKLLIREINRRFRKSTKQDSDKQEEHQTEEKALPSEEGDGLDDILGELGYTRPGITDALDASGNSPSPYNQNRSHVAKLARWLNENRGVPIHDGKNAAVYNSSAYRLARDVLMGSTSLVNSKPEKSPK